MCQNTNDWSQQTANTGIAAISSANSSLTGTGATTVYTAASANTSEGSSIKSIIIKAQQATLQGMVRLFISNGSSSVALYKEVPIPTTPLAATTPVPAPQYIMFQAVLEGDLKLKEGYSLLASTQNAQSFSVIVEGLDRSYPSIAPDSCCSYQQNKANTGIGTISTANTNLNGSGTIVSIFEAGSSANGSLVDTITIKALQSTQEDTIRFFISPDGSTWSLMREAYVPITTQSAYDPSYKQVIPLNFNLKAGYYIGASTQMGQSYAISVEAEDWTYPSGI